MRFEINNLYRRQIELTLDEVSTTITSSKEARELAMHLLDVVGELLEVEGYNE